MADDTGESEIPSGLPRDTATLLDDLDDHQLRLLVEYAQTVLRTRNDTPVEIEALPGEELVSVTEHDGYTAVVKRQPCTTGCDDCPHGPYLYHVTEEARPDGSVSLHWQYLGRTLARS